MQKLIEAIRDYVSFYRDIEDLPEDFNAQDWSGGNFDDAYEMGRERGERELAMGIRVLMKTFEENKGNENGNEENSSEESKDQTGE